MLIKEYRICLPMTVEEYRIAQLYMIQKKSRTESEGTESGVEIVINEPYQEGPGGKGQYTKKFYHIGSHMPSWFRAILPKSALIVEEEAWNAYPYTKTVYRTPFIEKFLLEIETVYHNDNGCQQNVFNLSKSELSSRIVDYLDIVKDQISSGDYKEEEDPTKYISMKTGRGPLCLNWREEFAVEMEKSKRTQGGKRKENRKEMMCAYKLCKVEFKYWGMQTKIEGFIHDIALRKTMLRAHRQAWCWQDEYFGLTMQDIRQLEYDTQQKLKEKMNKEKRKSFEKINNNEEEGRSEGLPNKTSLPEEDRPSNRRTSFLSFASDENEFQHIEKLQNLEDSDFDSEEDQFFDADQNFEDIGNSLLGEEKTFKTKMGRVNERNPHDMENPEVLFLLLHGGNPVESTDQGLFTKNNDLSILILTFESVLAAHYPSMKGKVFIELVPCPNFCSKPLHFISMLKPINSGQRGDICSSDKFSVNSLVLFGASSSKYGEMLRQVEESIQRSYFKFCRESFKRNHGAPFKSQVFLLADSIGSIFAFDLLTDFLNFDEKINGNLNFINDSDNLSPIRRKPPLSPSSRISSSNSNSPAIGRRSNGSPVEGFLNKTLPFEVDEAFFFGSPLGLVLSHRLQSNLYSNNIPKPNCSQIYNIFYSHDPSAFRLEPLLENRFVRLEPLRLQKFNKTIPEENLNSLLVETVNSFPKFFSNLKLSTLSLNSESSTVQGYHDLNNSILTLNNYGEVGQNSTNKIDDNSSLILSKWWGVHRIDYSLYSPDVVGQFPANSLPYILHSSFWESHDMASFILRQALKQDLILFADESDFNESLKPNPDRLISSTSSSSTPVFFLNSNVREKWVHKKTSFKVKKIGPNHRANDLVILEGKDQILRARFKYGLFDVTSLTGEKVDLEVKVRGQTKLLASLVTDPTGRIKYKVPKDSLLPLGLHKIKATVRVDQSYALFHIAVLPPKIQFVVFSVDGSFTASVSILGRDPRVRPGAVDVVRYWHEKGYLVLYISARPDMQQRKVAKWLSQHNFPFGFMWFSDGFSSEPLRQKAQHLRTLVRETQVEIRAAYGSNKDLQVYQSIGLQPPQIFIIGKLNKKNRQEATVIDKGYSDHLNNLYKDNEIPLSVNNNISFRTGNLSINSLSSSSNSSPSPQVNKTSSLPIRGSCNNITNYNKTLTQNNNLNNFYTRHESYNDSFLRKKVPDKFTSLDNTRLQPHLSK